MAITVTPETYIRAEVEGRFALFQQRAGGKINEFYLISRPVPTDEQPVVRMNRDTLYGGGVIDTAEGARVYVPEVADGRYVSLMVIDHDHYTVDVFHEPGWHDIDSPTRYCVAVPRVELHDMRDEDEIAHVLEVLHQFKIEAKSAENFVPADWDYDSMFALRAQYEQQFRTYTQYPSGWMGRRGEVDEATRHLAVAGAWGLFPEQEAVYINYTGPVDASKAYVATYSVPPCDAFWSIAVYGDDAFFHVDNATLSPETTQYNDDGTFTVYFGSTDIVGDKPNRLDITEGWNFLFRVYQPAASVLAREYTLPDVAEVTA
ncbi:hypothetical protein BJ978_000976 [Agromyces terreus]|uniref:DUF1214 domain-containing protein n=1 Tax=Agromyces terreus TaxID=424795 RepID=A0A9X2KBM2_9MICO|nr:DUF1214 domain-containing protein [Agromyces terreus]MCP2370300.1 hypothetical protein [Agromyces terreus]